MPVETIRAPGHSRDRTRTLGWLAVDWLEHFGVHGPGDIQGRPLSGDAAVATPLTTELASLTLDAYALDEDGSRLYDSVFYSRAKGCNKSGMAAWIALFEAFGPCRFAGFAEGGEVFEWMDFRYVYQPGEPMGRSVTYPLLRLLATEEGQTGNVYAAVHYNLTEGPLREAFDKRDDVGLTRVFLPGGGEIRPSTASSSAKDGGKETWTCFDETHLYILPELKRMYSTVRRNMAKRADAEPWSFETSTMYEPGRNSVAEESHAFAQKIREGNMRRPRLLFDHRQAPADVDLTDETAIRAALVEAYGDAASYMPIERIISEIWDTRNDVTDSRRYYFNQATAAADSWVRPDEWDVLADPAHLVADGAEIVLGFDGSKSGDHTAFIACEVETGHLWPLGIWDPQQHDPHDGCVSGRCGEVPRESVNAAVEQAFAQYDVVGFYADLQEFESYVDEWHRRHGESLCIGAAANRVAWNMKSGTRAMEMISAFHSAILDGEARHSGHKTLAQHVYNCRRRESYGGITVGKDSKLSPRKIDAAVAAGLAWQARRDYLALPDGKRRKAAKGVQVWI